jgi:hypothetical protein
LTPLIDEFNSPECRRLLGGGAERAASYLAKLRWVALGGRVPPEPQSIKAPRLRLVK